MRIIGIVILYYPDADVKNNISSYLDSIDKLIVWDNTPGGSDIYLPDNHKIQRMSLNENVGIGKALNEAVLYAKNNAYTHLLTMDQDSYFKDDDCEKYIETIKKVKQRAIFSPNYIIHGKKWYKEQDSILEVETTMTSGSLYLVSIFDEIGLFRDDFFIDVIDGEFSFRAKKNGILTKIIPYTYLIHNLGVEKKKYKFLWMFITSNERSPIRSYYIIRNGVITKHLYPWVNWREYFFYSLYKRLFLVLFYEKNKYAKCKGLLLGYIHGKMRKTGKQTIFNETKIVINV
ncbi:rhamnosyltransferase [Bacteroidales bacterium Barb4]|nr:rhamnosyltransferase [Bacteroidales bacterium Barb4]